jgi:hypothetical protein
MPRAAKRRRENDSGSGTTATATPAPASVAVPSEITTASLYTIEQLKEWLRGYEMVTSAEQLDPGQHIRYITLVAGKPCFKKGGLFVATFDDKIKLQNGNFYWFVKLHHYDLEKSPPDLLFSTLLFRRIPTEYTYRLQLETQKMENEDLQYELEELEADLTEKSTNISELTTLVSNLRDIVAKQYTVIEELYNRQHAAPSGLMLQGGGVDRRDLSTMGTSSSLTSSALTSSTGTSASSTSSATMANMRQTHPQIASLQDDTSTIMSSSSVSTRATAVTRASSINRRIRERHQDYLKKIHDPDAAYKSLFTGHFSLLQQLVSDPHSVAPPPAAEEAVASGNSITSSSQAPDLEDHSSLQQYVQVSML